MREGGGCSFKMQQLEDRNSGSKYTTYIYNVVTIWRKSIWRLFNKYAGKILCAKLKSRLQVSLKSLFARPTCKKTFVHILGRELSLAKHGLMKTCISRYIYVVSKIT